MASGYRHQVRLGSVGASIGVVDEVKAIVVLFDLCSNGVLLC
jgi:hypothetical protein